MISSSQKILLDSAELEVPNCKQSIPAKSLKIGIF